MYIQRVLIQGIRCFGTGESGVELDLRRPDGGQYRARRAHRGSLQVVARQHARQRGFREIEQALREMASGLERCMYCEGSQGTDIDHFEPRSRNPEQAFVWDNYLLACSHCNSTEKREQFPVDEEGQPLLIDPTDGDDDPRDHLALSLQGRWVPRTRKGTETLEVLGLN